MQLRTTGMTESDMHIYVDENDDLIWPQRPFYYYEIRRFMRFAKDCIAIRIYIYGIYM